MTVWCVAGDFNAITHVDERRGVSLTGYGGNEMEEFNMFIDNLDVLDIPLNGRIFTLYRPNSQSMSRLDRFLVSQDWVLSLPNCTQLVMDRDFSDHCPILLRDVVHNWGPKPYRVLNCWFQNPSFRKLVEDSCSNLQVHDRDAFVFKEKLKLLKVVLKKWNVEVFGDMNAM